MLPALLISAFPHQSSPLFVPEAGYARPANRVAGNKGLRILFVRTSFANEIDPAVSRHTEERLKKIGAQLDGFFKIQSYGQLSVAKVEVTPVLKLRASDMYEVEDANGKEIPRKDRRTIASDATAAARTVLNRNIRSEFDLICYLVNASPTKGRLVKRGVGAFATGPQTSVFFTPEPGWRLFAHEMGHCFGFPHSWSLTSKKKDQTIPERADRTFTEYGDALSPMGRGSNSYSLVERYRMGWIGKNPSDQRYIQKFSPGALSFGAYDRPDANGLVGGYLEVDLGLEQKELVSRREDPDEDRDAVLPSTTAGPQRLWLSVVTRGNLEETVMKDLEKPLLLVHVTALTGAKPPATQVNLDLTPAGEEKRARALESRGISPGESATLRLKDGRTLTLTFSDYQRDSNRATIETSIR